MPNIFMRLIGGSKIDKSQAPAMDGISGKRLTANMDYSKSNAGELLALTDLIKSSVDKIEAALASRSQKYPSINDPFTPESEAARMSPDVLDPGSIIIAAAAQLIATVRVPALSVMTTTTSLYIPACIRVAIETHVPEILREAGPQGAHVKAIAKPTGVDPSKLARILRLLSTNHIFKEVSPETFANNRLSSLLDTGKPVSEILKDPIAKHDNTPGLTALVEHISDEGFKAASYVPETITSPETALSGEPNQSPFNKAYNTTLGIFPWFELPENTYRFKRWNVAMEGAQNMASPGAILEGFDWKALTKGSVVVDVGGSVGSQTLALAKVFDHLDFVVQDRDIVIGAANKYWQAQFPEAIESGRVKLQAHDFFTPQPVKAPAVFFLRMILHDWSDSYCIKLLRQLRDAAGPDTQLLIVDNTISYSCPDTTIAHDIPGATSSVPPFPLLANKGVANTMAYLTDMHMLAMANGVERTVASFYEVLKEGGWKLVRVFHSAGFEIENSKVIAVPA